jgi:hypothetical protein
MIRANGLLVPITGKKPYISEDHFSGDRPPLCDDDVLVSTPRLSKVNTTALDFVSQPVPSIKNKSAARSFAP